MSADTDVAGRLPGLPLGARALLRRLAHAIVFGEAAILCVVWFSVILTSAASAGVLIQDRLGEMRGQGPVASTAVAPQTAGPAVTDFTLSPDAIRDLSPDGARAYNAGIPISTLPMEAARPFIMAPDQLEDYARALDCLTAAIYYEAASEAADGQAAVAQVVINRMRHPAFPKTVCGVVFEGSERATGCQFSFTCDGSLGRTPSVLGWARARAVAASALNGSVAAHVGMATHYHADWVVPYWAETLVKLRPVGAHIFYRWGGAWGLAFNFRGAHASPEPVVAKMAHLVTPVSAIETAPEILVDVSAPPPAPAYVAAPPPPVLIAETAVEPAPEAAPAPPRAAPAPVTVMPSPLPGGQEPPARRRARIAAPSGW